MQFDFATAGRIVFGSGAAARVPELARDFGRKALVVTGRDGSRFDLGLEGALVFAISGEPTVAMVREGAAFVKQHECDFVVGLGGGSAIDAGKAIAALASNSGEPLDYLEVVGRGGSLENPPLPYIAIPTTAGTGSEVTRNAVLASPEHGVKASLRSPPMLPRVAVVDPELTIGLPPEVTASTGLDALTQLIEPYVSCRANPMTDLFCVEGMSHVTASLARAYRDGTDRAARESMSFASLLGGLALANAGLGVVHGFAAPIGGTLDAPHGAVCAALLPHGMAVNIRAARERSATTLQRFTDVAQILTGNADALPEDGAEWVRRLCSDLGIRPLSAFGVTQSLVPELVGKASKASSMKANPIPLTRAELTEVLELSL